MMYLQAAATAGMHHADRNVFGRFKNNSAFAKFNVTVSTTLARQQEAASSGTDRDSDLDAKAADDPLISTLRQYYKPISKSVMPAAARGRGRLLATAATGHHYDVEPPAGWTPPAAPITIGTASHHAGNRKRQSASTYDGDASDASAASTHSFSRSGRPQKKSTRYTVDDYNFSSDVE